MASDQVLESGAITARSRARPPARSRSAPADAADPLADVQDIGDRRVFLSTVAPLRRDWLLATSIALASLLAFAAVAPFAKVQLAVVPAFIPAYESALLICDLITAILLFGQFSILRSRPLLVLAGGYLFGGLMAVPHALTFPGVFAATGLLGAGPQTTSWLYISWHILFPLVIIAYALLKGRETVAAGGARPHIIGAALIAVGAVVVLVLVAVLGEPVLPPILTGIHYTPTAVFSLASVGAISVLALVILWLRRPHSLLDLWLMVVMCAWLFDVGLSAVFNNGRYDLGFYAGRIYVLLGASFVLAVMLVETTRLYSRLAGAARRVTDYAATLETSVQTRTIELERSHEALKTEITEREQTEARLVQAQKMEAIGNLTGGMAHDFNNLLGVIIGNLDILLETRKDDPEVNELGREAVDAAVRGADLTRRLLAFARRQPLQPHRVDLNELVGGMIKLLSRLLGEDIEVSLDPAADIWPVVVDPAQLEASFTNLATNARDAMPRGGKLMIVTANRHLDADYAAMHPDVVPGDYAMIQVTDTGTGMTQETVAQIFEPFFTTKELGRGTGLGLSMVYGFMRQSGGHINVYSELGLGTSFRLYLPRAEAGAEASVVADEDELPPGRGERVLVVEDDAGMRRVVTRQLTEFGYRVIEAEDAAAALVLLETEGVDLLFSDIVLRGPLSGLELARRAKQKWPELRVVLTSGFPGKTADGIDAVGRLLVKPYRKLDLAHAIYDGLRH
jgi:signal transduction histidine kinase/CheY-like chemotaxis protein